VLTVNGRIRLWRRRWDSASEGTTTPLDVLLDLAEATISLGVRELACRLNGGASNFDKTADNLARAAQVQASGETLRQLLEAEGRAVLAEQRRGAWPLDWSAAECRTPQVLTRVYLGSDGVMIPLITDTAKKARRQKRRQRGRQARPLGPARAGADQSYKEFKIVAYYDETQAHCQAVGTRHDHEAAGRLMRREAARVLHAVKHEGYAALRDRLTTWRAGLRGGKRHAADRLLHYVVKREEMLHYPEFVARGWQIGSGPTQALCKTTTARLKGSGMRWDGDNAEAVMALACLEQSGQWRVYWQSRLRPTG
jgi:hypothetical protein